MRSPILLISSAGMALAVAAAGSRTEATPPLPDLCRRAPALQMLPAESPIRQQQDWRAPRGDSVIVTESRSRSEERSAVPPPPAPPPPPPPVMAAPVVSGVVSPSVAPAPPPASVERSVVPGPYRPFPAPPAGLLTAGDHDDLLNPRLYARYVWRAARDLGQAIAALPRVDTSRVLTIAVEDGAGRPAPFVPVTVRCANGASLTYATLADGRVTFYPDHDALGSSVTISVGGSRRQVSIDPTAGGQTQAITFRGAARPVRKLDMMIALDSTGSMGDEIEFLKSELRAIVDELGRQYGGLDIRVGLVTYRDEGDEYVTRTLPLAASFGAIQQRLEITRGEGGGDMPEAMDQALVRATGQDWRDDAVKAMLLVADAPPHDELQARAFDAVEAARARRVQIVPVAASGVDQRAEYFMRAAAALTQSRYIFLTDDSGIGNPHAEPDVDCYVVTQLATSIRRVLASMVSGQRIEPLPAEVIRTVGRYDHGKCVLPPAFDPQQ